MHAAIYLRVSGEEQRRKQLPIQSQLESANKYCEERGWKIVGEWRDEGISGAIWPRPGLKAMLHAVEHQGIDRIVCWDGERIARDTDLMGHIRFQLNQWGAQLVPISQETASDLERDIRTVIGAEYLRKVSKDIKRTLRGKAERHEPMGGPRLYGLRYVKDPKTNVRTGCEIVPHEAARIRQAFEMADLGSGHTMKNIRGEMGWTHRRLLDILRHPTYTGGYVYGRRRPTGKKGQWRMLPRNEWKVTWDVYPAIVERGLWDRVQERLDRNAELIRSRRHWGRETLPLTGLLRCSRCGRRMVSSGQYRTKHSGLRRIYYRCVGEAPNFRGRVDPCDGVGTLIPTGWVNAIVALVFAQLTAPNLAKQIAAELKRAHQTGRRTGHLEAEIRRLEKASRTITEMIRSGNVTDPTGLATEYDAIQRDLERTRISLCKERRTGRSIISASAIGRQLGQVAEDIAAVSALPDQDELDKTARPLLHGIIERIVVHEGGGSADIRLRWGDVLPFLDSYPTPHRCSSKSRTKNAHSPVATRAIDCRRSPAPHPRPVHLARQTHTSRARCHPTTDTRADPRGRDRHCRSRPIHRRGSCRSGPHPSRWPGRP